MAKFLITLLTIFITLNIIGQVKIVGGSHALPNEFPWMARLYVTDSVPSCGGSLIAPQWVLTAGHCVVPGLLPDSVRINSYSTSINHLQTEVFGISQIYVDPRWNGLVGIDFIPDIALIRLTSPSSHLPVEFISLPLDTLLSEENDTATVLGWGLTASPGSGSDTLKKANVIFTNESYCDSIYNSIYFHDPDTTLCAGYVNGNPQVGAGSGDSGGPLFVSKNGSPLLVGIVSAGGDAITTSVHPGVYTKIFTMSPWIHSLINPTAFQELIGHDIKLFYHDGALTVDINKEFSGKALINIYSLSGSLIESNNLILKSGSQKINLKTKLSGICIANVQNSKFNLTRKIMVLSH